MGNRGSVGDLRGLPAGMNERRAGTTSSWSAATSPASGCAAAVGLISLSRAVHIAPCARGAAFIKSNRQRDTLSALARVTRYSVWM